MPIRIPEAAGQPYRPSNGTEGDMFEVLFCNKCKHDTKDQACEILMRTMIFGVGDPEYPKEWVYDSEGCPKCTAFEKREG